MISGNVSRTGRSVDGALGGLTPVAAVDLTAPHLIVRLTSAAVAYYVGFDSLSLRVAADMRLEVYALLIPTLTSVVGGVSRPFKNALASGNDPTGIECLELPAISFPAGSGRHILHRVIPPGIGNLLSPVEAVHLTALKGLNSGVAYWFVSATATGEAVYTLRADRVQ